MKHKIFILSIILFLFPFTVIATDWVSMTSGTTNNLNGIWGSSASNIFAVGDGGTILHYDGNSWSAMTSGTTGTLNGIWGSSGSDVFALGGGVTIRHYNGSTWSPMQLCAHYVYDYLHGVWGNSTNDVFAVGSGSGGILNYNGSSWCSMNLAGIGYFLQAVWGNSGSDVFVVGTDYNGFSGQILHYDGISWSHLFSGANESFYGIWGSSGSNVFVVGNYYYHDSGSYYGTIRQYDGSTWSAMTIVPTPYLYAVWGSSGSDVFAVGSNGTILHYGEDPTVIDLSSFNVTPSNKEVTIQWTTESEIDNAGFNLYRSETENGEYSKINSSVIPAHGSPTESASYEFTDTNVQNRKTYYYKLEDIDLNGKSTTHGPIKATPRLIYGIGK